MTAEEFKTKLDDYKERSAVVAQASSPSEFYTALEWLLLWTLENTAPRRKD